MGVGLVVSQKGVVGPHLRTTTRLTQKWLPENGLWAWKFKSPPSL